MYFKLFKSKQMSCLTPFFLLGPKQDAEKAQKFILQMFTSHNENVDNRFYSHFTCATDTGNIQKVFQDVRQTIIQENLKDHNLV